MTSTLDGSELLTGPQAGGVLEAAVTNAGGELASWSLDHVDHRPGRSTKALFRTSVRWPELDGPASGARDELFGVSAHIGEQEKHVLNAEQSLVMTDGDMNVRVWRYPHDPWLPALPHVCYPDVLHVTLTELGIDTGYAPGTPVPVEVVSYRPGRRAVLRATLAERAVYVKVFQPRTTEDVVGLHHLLADAGVPVPRVLGSREGLMVLEELPGTVLAQAVVDEGPLAGNGHDLVAMLDRLPRSTMSRPVRPAWTESARFYAGVVASSLPDLTSRLEVLVYRIETGLADVERRIGLEPTDVVHGDFYEAQVFVDEGRVSGLLDIDGVGPGRRADDLACMFAHLSVLGDYANQGRLPLDVHERVAGAIRAWYPIFAARVDPQELALRAAGVVLSLATGPHRQQENNWQESTEAMVRVAETWVQVAEYGPHYVGPMPGGLVEQTGSERGEGEAEDHPASVTSAVEAAPETPGRAFFEQDPTIPLPPIADLTDRDIEIALAHTANRAGDDAPARPPSARSGKRAALLSPPTPVTTPWARKNAQLAHTAARLPAAGTHRKESP
ncbi:MAG: phosphotransferase [Dermabacter sp.]|nr:phosphotransferase [Dermabacter sp.]